MNLVEGDVPRWFVMRVAYQQEMKAKAFCDGAGNNENGKVAECYIPMKYAEVEKRGKKVRKLVPAIHNLCFIQASGNQMASLKPTMEAAKIPVRYLLDKATGKPMIVPDRDMEVFIAVSGTNADDLIYLMDGVDEYPKLVSEDRVRVTGGPFEGAEGYVVRVKKDRRVMVKISGTCAVLTSFIHPSFLQKI
jgi:transcription antitermination factor NusG